MKKLLTTALVVLIGSLIFSCKSPESTEAPDLVSPLSPISKAIFDSPLDKPADAVSRFSGKIAFHSDRTGVLQIYVLHGDTGESEGLTDGSIQSFEPSWSPDCQSVAYAFGDSTGDGFEIYTMRADGSEKAPLFENPSVNDWSPAWSPKGDLLAFQTNEGGILNVCFVDLNGESKGCLESEFYSNALPAWSPDGEKMLFISNRDGGDWDIFVTSVDGGDETVQLTRNDYTDTSPQFSPDGRFIVFVSERLDNYDVFIINSDGTNEVQLTSDPAEDVNPRWVGNEQLVFASVRTLDWNLYLMNRDGSNVTQLTYERGLDKWPVWCPSD